MNERLIIVRENLLRDLIALGREAAGALRERPDAHGSDLALASALDGSAAAVATDTCEDARLPACSPQPV